ncbi:FtsK/SpoIIIE domain-containing protein, partial [Nocardia sp. NPDC003648]
LMALPRVDGSSDPLDLSAGVAHAVELIAQRTPGRPAPGTRTLPDLLDRTDLLRGMRNWPAEVDRSRPNMLVPIGVNESELAPVMLNLADTPHFLVFGDSECGKTALLRGIVQGLVESNEPAQAKIILGDYRRTLLGTIETNHLAGYAPSAEVLTPFVQQVVGILKSRMPGANITQQELRARSWWTGPELYLIIDDYDLVVTPSGNPLSPLVEFIPHAKDIGFHLIIARRSGGASRALYEPVVSRMRDVGCIGLVMSGSRDEGQLFGTVRASAMPPGRGTLVTRNAIDLVQLAWAPAL